MKRAESGGKSLRPWPSIVAGAWLVGCLWAAPGPAQAPAILPTMPPPPVDPSGPPGGPLAAQTGSSTVSSVIERFVHQSGRDLAPVAGSPAARVAQAPVMPRPAPPISEPPAAPPGAVPASPTAASAPRATGTELLATDMTLKPAPLDPTDLRYPINLATALRLADARPLIIARAQAGVWVAEAELTRAKVIWVPTLNVGADYLRHDGGGPDFNKGILTAPSTNFLYAGAGLSQIINLTDAIFAPLAARQVLNSRHYDVQTAKNDALLRVSDAYFQVHQARGLYAGTLYTVERGKALLRKIEILSEDLVTRVEVDRAKNLLADLEQRAVLARQDWRVGSADLTQTLRLDPRAVVEPLEHDHAQVTLIDPGLPLDELMSVALANRPELGSRRALVEAAEYGVRREKARPLLPVVQLSGYQSPGGYLLQGGVFGLGPNSSLNQFTGRADVGIQATWQLEGFGIGNLARIKAQRGLQSRSIIELRRAQDTVAGEVTRAQARVQSAAVRILQADRSLRTGIISFNGQLEGLGQTRRFGDVLSLVYRPQEVIFSLDLLDTAFREYFKSVSDYNRAQFDLFHSLGYPARELSGTNRAGQPLPVDPRRPSYLPPVGTGPPPATR